MVTSIDELRQSAQKEVTHERTGHSFRIRKLDPYDFIRAEMTPLVAIKEQVKGLPDPKTLEPKIEADLTEAAMTKSRYLLERGGNVFFGEESDTPDGKIHISWIPEDAGFLTQEILKFSGMDEETQKTIEALAKNANGSETSMKSEESSASSQAN